MSIQSHIESKLAAGVAPSYLEVINESHMHSVPPNSETHFKAVIVSSDFEGKRSVARHQMVYKLLVAELEGPVHALALHTYTPSEWLQRDAESPTSPDCLGGSKHEA